MVLFKNLMLRAARRLVSDPRAREQAMELAKKAKPVVDKAVREAKTIHQASDPAREMGRLAGRLKRKYLDGDGGR